MDLVISEMRGPVPGHGDVEIVERKGLGHPDTICDALAEEVGRTLSRAYLDRFGAILHHNVDKVLLVGGASRPGFGGGVVDEPIRIFLAGRATRAAKGETVPVDDLARDACRRWLADHLRHLDVERDVEIHPLLRPGSVDLVDVFMRQAETGRWFANDTSCGAGYAPLSDLERMVLRVERRLNARETRAEHPAFGEDVKVLGVRRGRELDLTVATAFVDRYVSDLDDYRRRREAVRDLVREIADAQGPLEIEVNAADDLERGSVYLTVTGTSAEGGDDGEAGRGNRANGLITPYRPMTMESLAGKNPTMHVGKLYNVAASRIAEGVVESLEGVDAAECVLVSRIGRPVDDPHVAHLRVHPADGTDMERLQGHLGEIVREHLDALPSLWEELIRGEVSLF
ncbi:MAG: methionine adenosyltransferase [Myxococcota bacterium]